MGFATNQDLTTVKTNVGSDSDASSSTGSVHGKLKDLKASLPTSPIKSFQRGRYTASISGGTSVTVTISTVNMTKAELKLLTIGNVGGNAAWAGYDIQLTSSTQITINNYAGGAINNISWEVIEYN